MVKLDDWNGLANCERKVDRSGLCHFPALKTDDRMVVRMTQVTSVLYPLKHAISTNFVDCLAGLLGL